MRRIGAQLLPQMRHRPLDRAQAHLDALLDRKLLADHVGIAGMTAEPILNPGLKVRVPRDDGRPFHMIVGSDSTR